jgi:hypothetical protein
LAAIERLAMAQTSNTVAHAGDSTKPAAAAWAGRAQTSLHTSS